jgi:glycosyltransferase involved in cell wall biosynthesis
MLGKILYFVSEDWYFCSHRLPIARAAKKNGFEVVVVTNVNKHEKIITDEGFRLIPIKLNRRGKNPLKELSIIFNLIKIFKEEKPDIVHNVALKPIIYGSIAALFSAKSYVVNAFAGMGYIFTGNDLRHTVLKNFFLIFYKLIFLSNKSIGLFQNSEDQNFLLENNIISVEKSFLVKGSGVNLQNFSFKKEPEDNSIKLVIASRMLWDKGIGELVEASKLLNKKNIKFKTILVGLPDPHNPESIDGEILEEWNKQSFIEYLGFRNDVSDIITKSNIVVLPSYREGLPKFLLEGAACGRAIVTTDVPGCRDVVRNNINGFLVPPKNVAKLADALEQLINDKKLRLKFGKAGRKIVENEFSEEIVIEKTLNLYKSLLNK